MTCVRRYVAKEMQSLLESIVAALAVRQPREEVICERLLVDPENKGEWAS